MKSLRTPLPERELRALVSLVDDRDPKVADSCRRRLVEEGAHALPVLRDSIVVATGDAGDRLREVFDLVQAGIVDGEFASLSGGDPGEPLDLEVGAFLLARTADPDLDVDATRQRIDDIAHRLRPQARELKDPVALALMFRTALAEEEGLRGNESNYYDPENSFIHRVLDRRVGIPISLSTIYLLVARRIDVPLHGIGMPGHFVVQCGDQPDLFLDPFNGGRLLNRNDCLDYLDRAGFGADESLLNVMPDRFIVARMIANLLSTYRRLGNGARAERYERLFELVRGEPAPT